MTEMTCKEVVDAITAYIDESLSEADRTRFATHLDGCPACRDYLLQMRETIARLGSLDEARLSEPMRRKLVDAFRDWRAAPRR
jgi:anti-sigma factor RsiW